MKENDNKLFLHSFLSPVSFGFLVCSNMAFSGDFTPVLAKHTKNFNLIDALAVGVDRTEKL